MPSMDVIDKLWDRWIKFPLSQGNILSIEDVRSRNLLRYVELDLSSDVRRGGDF